MYTEKVAVGPAFCTLEVCWFLTDVAGLYHALRSVDVRALRIAFHSQGLSTRFPRQTRLLLL